MMAEELRTEHKPLTSTPSALVLGGLLQRKCACGTHTIAGGECSACQAKSEGQRQGTVNALEAPSHVHDALGSQGQPLDAGTRAFMEPRFAHDFSRVASTTQSKLSMTVLGDSYEQEADHWAGQVMSGREPQPSSAAAEHAAGSRAAQEDRRAGDFSRVRTHTDARAAEAARSINARAFTVGQDIFFGQGQYAPQTAGGRQLLAHELTHVMQQGATGAPVVARQGLEQYETSAVRITGANMEKAAESSYWEQKVSEFYLRVNVVPVKTRFDADSEERDAVLSTLWNMRPKTVAARTTMLANIPARKGAQTSKALTYQFTFIPTAKGETLPRVEISFVAEGAAATTVAAPSPAATYSPSSFSLSHGGFPGNDFDKYFKAHPEEHKQVFNWIENVATDPFEQVITTQVSPPPGSKTPPRKASFLVKGKKPASGVQDLEIQFLGAMTPTTAADPPAGYHDKERLDLNIEKAQTQAHAKKKDKLGAITGLDTIPADEKTPVKYAIWQYFDKGETRKAEVDVIVPVMTTGRRVFYTLRFKPGNDVEVERVGEEGTDAKAKQKSLAEMDVARVRGFTDNAKDPTTLTTWLKKRYPSVTPQGKTVEELRQSVNTAMQADAGKPDWFKTNYDLKVVPVGDAAARLKDKHGVPAALTTDVQDFTPSDLNFVEFALQTMGELVRAFLKGVHLVRKTMGIAPIKAAPKFKADADVAGIALQNGSEKTIAIFDKAKAGDDFLFLGGKGGVRQEATETAAHEFGHIVEENAGIKAAFAAYVAKHKIKPITWYAAKQPSQDFFTEAFALYYTDPEWMKNNVLKLYEWFEILEKTGAPPPP
jgi:hypothetical protein